MLSVTNITDTPQVLTMVIVDCGDGSNAIEYHRFIDDEKFTKMEEEERYRSGDGVQIRELKFPADFDMDAFVRLNKITFAEDMEQY